MGINLNDPRLSSSKWFKWQDMPEGMQSAIFTIEAVSLDNYAPEGQKEKWKITLWFVGFEKGFGLNVGNGDQVKTLLGEDTDAWVGQQIVLAIERTMFEGSMVNCLRVHPVQQPQQPAPAPAPVQQPAPQAAVPAEPAGYADVPLAGSDEPPF